MLLAAPAFRPAKIHGGEPEPQASGATNQPPGSIKRPSQSTAPLPSPSLLAARVYYCHDGLPIGQKRHAMQRRRSLFEVQHSAPRRHSTLARSDSLASHIAALGVSCSSPGKSSSRESGSNTEEPDDISTIGTDTLGSLSSGPSVSQENEKRISEQLLRNARPAPFSYTHDHLRDWGYAYLGNVAAADAFINPVNLRHPCLTAVKKDDGKTTHLITILARVLPKSGDRKPVVIQKDFDVEGLRASITLNTKGEPSAPLRRSGRARRSPTQQLPIQVLRRRSTEGQMNNATSLQSVPIHIEYALHYLPILAALLLSGHVKKGDTVDLPIPHPAVWEHVMTFIYTGRGPLTSPIRSNILFLAGNV